MLDIAEALVRTRGFDDYRFRTKAELGRAPVSRVTERFMGALEGSMLLVYPRGERSRFVDSS